MDELALFAGAGGGILGGHLLGWRTVCAVEWNAYAASVLCARQNDGVLAPFPIWDDVRTFDGRPWRGRVDVVSGGFPCQDISVAGNGSGIDGERSGLWIHMARIIREVGPRFVFVENSPALTVRGLDRVLGDLAAMGYDARWGVLGAVDAGAPHRRERIWIVAIGRGGSTLHVADADGGGCEEFGIAQHADEQGVARDLADGCGTRRWRIGAQELVEWWKAEPNVGRVAHGVAARVDRLRAIGNGQVPAVAAIAWEILSNG